MENLSCIYCKGGEIAVGSVGQDLTGFTKKIFVYVHDDKLRVFGEGRDDAAGYIPINFCPKCGRKLRKKTNLYNSKLAADHSQILNLPI